MNDSQKTKEQLIEELEALRDSKTDNHGLFETMRQGVVYQDATGQILRANPAATRILGLTFDQMQGRTSIDPHWRAIHVDGSDFPGQEHPAMVALKTGKPVVDVIMGVVNPQEEEHRWISIDAVPEFIVGETKPYRVHTIFTDITERKRVEEKLRKTESRFRRIYDSGLLAVAFWDVQGAIHEANDTWLDMIGYTRDDLESGLVDWAKMTPPEYAHLDQRGIEQITVQGYCEPFEKEYVRKDGSRVQVLIGGADIQGTNESAVTFAIDITERKRLEAQLIQSQKMEAVGTLAGGVAHDMNNVLAVVLGLGSVLESEMRPDDSKIHDVQEIIAAARRGKSLVENLLGFARKGRYQRDSLSLNDTVRQLTEVLGHSIPKRIAINTALDDQLAAVECDAAQMTQTLINLCINASDAIDGKGTITIATRNEALGDGDVAGLEAGQYVKLQVKDDGPGMDEETRTKAFEPFFTTKDVGRGTGLGLSMAYGVIENHGGVIQIDSAPGEGTSMNIWLPAVESDGTQKAQKAQEASRLDGNKCMVLLVDDEEMIRKAGKRMLEAAGYDVVVAEGGNAALEIFKSKKGAFGLVLLDLSMPVMDGVECFEKLKEIDPSVRVLICTGHGSPRDTDEMIGNGAVGVVCKPFDLEQLSEAIAAAIPDAVDGSS